MDVGWAGLLLESPLTCMIAATRWIERSDFGAKWAPQLALLSSEARAGVLGGVPQICVLMICILITVLIIASLWSIANEGKGKSYSEGRSLDEALSAMDMGHIERRRPPEVPALTLPSPVPHVVLSRPSRPAPICPKLMLPHGAAQFQIPMDSVRKLRSGVFPIQVLGASGAPLLHAWLPRLPLIRERQVEEEDCLDPACASGRPAAGGQEGPRSQGLWLQLTTTRTSRHPHACIGPLVLGHAPGLQQEAVQILGPGGKGYGTFEQTEDGWKVVCEGSVALTVTSAFPFPHLTALDFEGNAVASCGQKRWSIAGADALVVQVSQGADALLALLCMLAVVLMSVDIAVPAVDIGMFSPRY